MADTISELLAAAEKADFLKTSEAREQAAILRKAASELLRLNAALHQSITRQPGVVPDLALEFYDQTHPELGHMRLLK